jgi:hypothetical protein
MGWCIATLAALSGVVMRMGLAEIAGFGNNVGIVWEVLHVSAAFSAF